MAKPDSSRKLSMASARYVFRTILWPRRRLLLLGLVLILVNRLSGLVLPGSTRFLIDEVVALGDTSFLPTLLTVVGAAICAQAVTSFFLTRLLSVEAQGLIATLRAKVQAHVVHLPVGYFDSTKSGELVSRIMTDVEGVRNLVGTGFVLLLGGVLTAGVAFVLLMRIDQLMTLMAILPLVVFGLIARKAFSYIRPIFRERAKIRAEVTGRLTEALGGIRVIKGFNAEESEKKVFISGVTRLYENVKRTLTAQSLVMSSSTLLLGLGALAILCVGGMRIIDGDLTTGGLFAFTMYLAALVMPVVQIANIGSQMTEAFAGLDRMQEMLAVRQEVEEPGRTHALSDIGGDITFEGVSFAYLEEREVLRDVDLHARPGTVTALVGSSGSGKTTLAGLAASFLAPTRGTVRVDGIDLSTVDLPTYRGRLGVVLQDDFLFDGTIRENLLFARPGATEEDVTEAARAAHVLEFTDDMPDGLDTVIGERGVKLSGGQRQRVSIARAILADPRILILDEATSSLDTESEAYIQESLGTLMEGRTTFVIAHRLSTIRRADQILVLEDGQVVERGTHDELIEREGRYHRLYTYQARI
ncbi:MAG: ABC transporter ATP-binding protein [Planctomycetota bacterium]|jgi:subfamily B ATP-binding cassette protein MsbA